MFLQLQLWWPLEGERGRGRLRGSEIRVLGEGFQRLLASPARPWYPVPFVEATVVTEATCN